MEKHPCICAYCDKEIEPAERAVMVENRPCCPECAARMKVQLLLERDPEISRWNSRFHAFGAVGLICGVISILLLFVSALATRLKWAYWLQLTTSILGFVLLAVFLILFIARVKYQRRVQEAVQKKVPEFRPEDVGRSERNGR